MPHLPCPSPRCRALLPALFALAVAVAALAEVREAEAAVVEGNAVTITAVAIGTAGGMATSIAGLVYSMEGRAFDDGWVTTTLFTSAICGATAVAMGLGLTNGGGGLALGGAIFYAILAGWPLYWTVKGALADVDPGERFEPVAAQRPTLDPLASLEPRALGGPRGATISVPVLGLAF